MAVADIVVKQEAVGAVDLEERICELCKANPKGISDQVIQQDMPAIPPQQRVTAINRLLSIGRLELLRSGSQLLYRYKDVQAAQKTKGFEVEEKVVYQIIEEAGNKGIWIRDIRYKCNLQLTQLNKILKNLESKKLIKAIKSVAASKKKVYMLFTLEPDISVTGGAWYSDQEFESEFVEVLNQQCFKFLQQKVLAGTCTRSGLILADLVHDHARTWKDPAEPCKILLDKFHQAEKLYDDPVARKNASYSSSDDVWKYISQLGISKVQLSVQDIETILNTLIYDGKAETVVVVDNKSSSSSGQKTLYRAVFPIMPSAGLMRTPCGVCPVVDRCHDGAAISPKTCIYMKEWLDV